MVNANTGVHFHRKRIFSLAICIAIGAIGCGGRRIPEPLGPHPTEPHISWSIHAGTAADPEQLLVCQSAPRSECVVGANRQDRKFFATGHLYLHPASSQTTYTGVVRPGFFASSVAAQRVDVNATVKPGEKPRESTVYDLLPTKPGAYVMEIDLVATPASGEKRDIRERVDVVVK
jgi:hypothetical protein